MQPTCRRSAQTGAGHGSPAPVERARAAASSRRRGARACTLPRTVQASSVRCPPAVEPVAGLAVGGASRPSAARRRRAGARPQNAISSSADASMTESFAVTSAPSTATTGPTMQWSSVDRRRTGAARSGSRAPTECGVAVGVAREPGHERAVAQDERARLARPPTPRSRAARRRARARRGRSSCPAPSRACSWSVRESSGRARLAERSASVAVGGVRRRASSR